MVDSRNATDERIELRMNTSCRRRDFFGNLAGIQKILFNPVTQPAQQCSGLDIPDRETVPEPDGGFIVSRFQRYFVHSHIPFLFPGKKGRGRMNRGTSLIRV